MKKFEQNRKKILVRLCFELKIDQEVTARPALCKKPIVAMLVAHMAANNCFFILFNWLPAYFHTKYPDASASIYSSVPWSLTLFGSIGSGYICDKLGSKYNMTFGRKLVASVALGARILVHSTSYHQIGLVRYWTSYKCNKFIFLISLWNIWIVFISRHHGLFLSFFQCWIDSD